MFRFGPVSTADSSSSCIIVIGGAVCLAYDRCKTGYRGPWTRSLPWVQAQPGYGKSLLQPPIAHPSHYESS